MVQKLLRWLPRLDHRVWMLIAGRLLSQLGSGFTLFYAPIFFVNQVGLSATTVGFGLGSASISGIVGRILGGSFSDSAQWGRRKTLLLSAAISALASGLLALATNFSVFLVGNLLMGLGIGLYWPATEAVVADLTTLDQRNEAFALTRLGDSVGLGLGVILGGWLIALTGAYRALFVIDAISFVVFFGIIYWSIAETLTLHHANKRMFHGWANALRDRPLLIYVVVNILFTTYLAFINSAIPLYFTNYIEGQRGQARFDSATISALFAWHIVLAALTQLPVARQLNRFTRPQTLMISALFWGIGFIAIGMTGITTIGHLVWAVLSLGILAIATVAYMPAASSLVVELAPEALRGVYLAINSLCWAVGYFIGPALGGWAMDQPRSIANGFWLATALSVIVAVGILHYLDRITTNAKVAKRSN